MSELEGDISLEKLAELWKAGKITEGEIPIEKIAPIWRVDVDKNNFSELELSNERAMIFWRSVAGYFKRFPIQKDVCAHLLTILDKEGNCPSVVNAQLHQDDTEASWDSNSYGLLGMTTLLDHSINVAEKMVKQLLDIQSEHIIPDGIIAALAHDIGKIPSMRTQMYSTGDHPIAAGSSLAALNSFQKLPEKDREEISKAVKYHHRTMDGLLPENLRRADGKARQEEMDWATAELARQGRERRTMAGEAPPVITEDVGQDKGVDQEDQVAISTEEAPPANAAGLDGGQSAPSAVVSEPLAPASEAPAPSTDDQGDSESEAAPEIQQPPPTSAAVLRDGLTRGDVVEKAGDEFTLPNALDLFASIVPPESVAMPDEEVEAEPAALDDSSEGVPAGQALAAIIPPPPYPMDAPQPTILRGNAAKAWATEMALNGSTDNNHEANQNINKNKPSIVAIDHWFDMETFLHRIKIRINKTVGKRFEIFSMRDGVVYCQVKIIEQEIRLMASEKHATEITNIAPEDLGMRQYIFSVVSKLRQHGFIEDTLIKDDYFAGYFMVQKRSGQRVVGYYTPFRSEAFGMLPSELEDLKVKLGSKDTLDFISVELSTKKVKE